ncbi:uncharacterized protein LOC144703300 [Wolffia australiana]
MADGGAAADGAAPAKVRVVRCPKCQKLLPELAGFTVYRCGGCNATLRAKPRGPGPVSEERIIVSECADSCSDGNGGPTAEGEPMDQRRRQRVQEGPSSCGSAAGQPRASGGPCRNRHRDGGVMRGSKAPAEERAVKPPTGKDEPSSSHPARLANPKVETLEQDRAILLQKLDELRDQLSRTCDVKGKTSETGDWLKSSSSVNRAAAARQFPLPAEPPPSFYPPLAYPDAFEQPPLRRGPYRYPARPAESYLYEPAGFYPHPPLAYPHCYDAPWHEPSHRAGFHGNSQSLYPVDDQFMLRPGGFGQRGLNGLHQHRAMPARWARQSYKPLAGGAPFVVCPNCSELLHVSPHLLSAGKPLQKLRCGSCSEVISFKLDGSRLNVASPPLERGENLEEAVAQGLLRTGSRNHARSAEEKLFLSSPGLRAGHETIDKDYGLNLSESENLMGSSSCSSDDNGNAASMLCHRDAPSSPELRSISDPDPRVSGLPLRDHFGYSSPAALQAGKPAEGSRSKRFDQEKMVEINENYRQHTVKDVAVASDTDSPISGSYNHASSLDSGEIFKEEDRSKTGGKGGDSFFAGFIKKSFKDFSRFNQSPDGTKYKVTVNGHPIPDRVVKRAEKIAGPIQAGDYWYDHEAGFWGVMGQPCLGIIPPFIEEFNYPMPKNCSSGNSGVVVNGRELHQKDLDLLVGRGLPPDYGRSYRIDISGKVVDDVSGEELDSLGKLAPTIEKVKHGFGMRAPRTSVGSA